MSCKHFGGELPDEQAPFNYFSFGADGQRSGPLPAVLDEASGLCWYPQATCGGDQGGSASCCELSEYGASFPVLGFLSMITLPCILAMYVPLRCNTCKKRFQQRGVSNFWKQYFEMEERVHQGGADLEVGPVFRMLGTVFFMASLAIGINVLIHMNEIAQSNLSVTGRNGMIVAEGILNPMDDIFSFIDDIIMVKIGIAAASGDAAGMRKVFWLGTVGGVLCGCFGACIATIVAFVEPLRDAALDPFSTSLCTLTKGDVDATAVYFALSAWQWPFTFASNAFAGFAVAINDLPMFGFVMLTRNLSAFILILTVFKSKADLEVLGWIRLGSAVLGFVLWCLSTLRPGIRRRIGCGARPEASDASAASDKGSGFFADASTRKALQDGLCAMGCELTVEAARTITLFVAAHAMGAAAFYQVSAHFTMQMGTGMGIGEAVFGNLKIIGSKLLGGGLNYHFVWFFEYCAVAGLAVVIGCFAATYTSIVGYTFTYGHNACVFAAEEACLLEYGNFFGGHAGAVGSTMMTTAKAVAPVVLVRVAYRICRSTLYAMQDFPWMVKVSLGCFTFFFVPAVALLSALSESALAAVLVMTIPNATVLGFFAWRIRGHIGKLDAGVNPVLEAKGSFVKQRSRELGLAGSEAPGAGEPVQAKVEEPARSQGEDPAPQAEGGNA